MSAGAPPILPKYYRVSAGGPIYSRSRDHRRSVQRHIEELTGKRLGWKAARKWLKRHNRRHG